MDFSTRKVILATFMITGTPFMYPEPINIHHSVLVLRVLAAIAKTSRIVVLILYRDVTSFTTTWRNIII